MSNEYYVSAEERAQWVDEYCAKCGAIKDYWSGKGPWCFTELLEIFGE